MSDWVQSWEALPELERECLGVVNGKYKLIHMETETNDWYSGGRTYEIWVSTDGYGDIIEHDDVSMWKYLDEIPNPTPMTFDVFKSKIRVVPAKSLQSWKELEDTENELISMYNEYKNMFTQMK